MRGYAPSGIPRSGRYHAEALGRDLLAVAEQLGEGAPVRLAGHDWGAVAVYAAAALAPERFSHLAAMAVPHLRVALRRWLRPAQLRRSWYMGMFQLPGVSERRLLRDDLALVERLWRDWSPGYRCPPASMRRIKDAIAPRGTEVLSYYRELVPGRGSARTTRLLLARCKVPSLYLHGADDGCIGAELTRDLDGAFERGLELHVLPAVGHFLHLEAPERVNELLLRFFAAVPQRDS
jgi:pimeloyl-ACP methyl ester carboxylesterase